MNVKETDFPEKFRPIIRRLQSATQEQEVRDIMIVEDDFLSELQDYENRIVDERKLRDEALRKQKEALRKQEEAIKFLLELGVSKTDIASKLNIQLSDIDRLLKLW